MSDASSKSSYSNGAASTSTATSRTSQVAAQTRPQTHRKRVRSDSADSPRDTHRPREKNQKMFKAHGFEDTDTDTEMDAIIEPASASTSNLVTEGKEKGKERETAKTFVRDERYYFEDGSCVLLVQDTLFNVHRSILSNDSSSFSTMFSLPQGGQDVEGRSDANPIVLIGDTPEEFRHFIWALYALPHELKIVTSPHANLLQLIDIARVSNKYSFKSLETWALDAIQEYVNRKPSPILGGTEQALSFNSNLATPNATAKSPEDPAAQNETADQLTRLIRLAQLCQHERLLSTMINLLRQLMSTSVRYAYLAMTLADELDLRTLRGAAYLEVMQKAVVVKKVRVDVLKPAADTASHNNSSSSLVDSSGTPLPQEEGSIDASGRLIVTRAQQLRLLAGYYRLTSVWDKLRREPLPFEHSHACGATWHQQGCTQSWLEFWKEKTRSDGVMNLGMADVLGRLKLVQKEYDRWGSATYMHHDCRLGAKRAIGDVIKRVEEALPDYFAEPGEFEDD
ncbi:hypothetical protein JR316_0007409 [Psilocybe cubensis]|uniref:BTB domain-containing protein n=2 Tax=Psilocybe cubensis TaxID=181762 RepID=A0A8H8CGV9_PSICU|nr:hypothetical protein JR316_0007409 [Psilocybe cubensis]KAH9480809.1 hypothetical protein JR316_0007409 [Psilocybe cubensis]